MATSSFIPKEGINAYQRWEMSALDAPDPTPEKKDQQLNTEDNPLPARPGDRGVQPAPGIGEAVAVGARRPEHADLFGL